MRLFITLLLLTPALAGCFGGGSDALDPGAADGAGDVPTLPEGLEMEGAEVVAQNETSIIWQWDTTIGPAFGNPADDPPTAVEAAFTVPASPAVLVEADLEWEHAETRFLGVAIVDEAGHERCRDGRDTVDEPARGACWVATDPSTEAVTASWRLRVYAYENQDDLPFTAELSLTTLPPREGSNLAFTSPARIADQVNPVSEESFIEVSPDGNTILTCQHGGFQQPSPMFASTDGGATFSRLTPPAGAPPGGDCEVAMDDDGTWYFLSTHVMGTTLLVAGDEGSTWAVRPVSAPPLNGATDRPWLEARESGTLYLSYQALAGHGQPGGIGFTRSDDAGQTWTPTVLVATPEDGARASVVTDHMMVADGGETIQIPFHRFDVTGRGAPSIPALATSHDGGTSWRVGDVSDPVEGRTTFPSAARAGDHVYWAYGIENEDTRGMFVLHSADGGDHWSDPIEISPWPGARANWIDGRPDGSATLVVQRPASGDIAPGTLPQLIAFRLGPAQDGISVEQATIAFNGPQEFVAVDHDGEGRAYVTYTDSEGIGHYMVKEVAAP